MNALSPTAKIMANTPNTTPTTIDPKNNKTKKNIKPQNPKKQPKGLIITQWNKGSSKMTNRIPNIELIINEHNPHIIVLNEANVTKEELARIHFPDYTIEPDNLIDEDDMARTVMIIHKDINYTRCRSLEQTGLSTVWIRAGLAHQKKIMINGFYRQWRKTKDTTGMSHLINQQRERLTKLLEPWKTLTITDQEVITIGDINLPNQLDKEQTKYEKKLAPLVEEYNNIIHNSTLTKLNTTFTRQMAGVKDTSPDQIHISHPSRYSDPTVHDKSDSDHNLLQITRQTTKPLLQPRYRKTRNYKNLDKDEFAAELLKDHRYIAAIIDTDTNHISNHIQSLIRDKLDVAAPETTIQISHKTHHKISQQTRELIRDRDEARITARQTGDQDDWRKYRNLRNNITTKLKQEYQDQDEKQLNPNNNTPAQLWSNARLVAGMSQRETPRRLIHNGRHIDKPKEMANVLNNEYISRAEEILASIPASQIDPLDNFNRMLKGRHLNMTLRTISLTELHQVMRSMRPTRSTAYDGISMKLVKQQLKVLIKPLLNLVNTSISSNTFPDNLKIARIIPILKHAKDPSQPKSWRPVNLLPSLSKIIEKVVVAQLKEHLEKHALIPGNHTGSRKRNTTTTAAITLHDMWSAVLHNDLESVVLQLDQSAAYDIVSHDILQRKLRALGLDDNTMRWFVSYMSDRKQAVSVEASQSETKAVGDRSVIQGSTLSCLMYLIYIMDMPSVTHIKNHTPLQDANCLRPTTLTYVDDLNTTVTTTKDNPQHLTELLHNNLQVTQQYMNANRLSLNSEKTKIFIISKHPDRKNQVKLVVGDKIIAHTKTINVLGIKFNDKLNWNNHITTGEKSLAQQIRHRLVALRTISRSTTTDFSKQLATGLILSRVEYAIALWGTAPQHNIDVIQKLLNKAARIALGPRTQRWSISRLMSEMGWLKVNELIRYHQCCLIHQIIYTGSPQYLRERILTERTGRTRSYDHRKLGPKPKNEGSSIFTKNNFVSRSYETYNNLPPILTSIPIRSIFKIRLRRFLKNPEDIPNDTDRVYGKFLHTNFPITRDRCQEIPDATSCPDTDSSLSPSLHPLHDSANLRQFFTTTPQRLKYNDSSTTPVQQLQFNDSTLICNQT